MRRVLTGDPARLSALPNWSVIPRRTRWTTFGDTRPEDAHRRELGHTMALLGRAPEVQPVEAERCVHVVHDHLGQLATRDSLHDLTDQPAVGQGVVSTLRARLVGGRFGGEGLDHVVPVEHVVRAVDHAAQTVEPGGVAQHMADGDVLLAVLGELGPVRRHAFVVVDETRFGLEVEGDRRHTLRRAEAHRQRVGFPRITVRRSHTAPQVDDPLTAMEDRDGRAAVGARELVAERLRNRVEPWSDIAFHGFTVTRRRPTA